MHDVTSLLSFSLFLLAVAMQMQCPTCQAHPSEDLEEMKRGWNNFHSGYGKRAWNNNFMSGYGKRDSYEYDQEDPADSLYEMEEDKRAWNSNFNGGLGKRAWNSGFNAGLGKRAWNSRFNGGLGKRAWNSFSGGYGKRAWNSFSGGGGFGKRSVDDDEEESEHWENGEIPMLDKRGGWDRAVRGTWGKRSERAKRSKSTRSWITIRGVWG